MTNLFRQFLNKWALQLFLSLLIFADTECKANPPPDWPPSIVSNNSKDQCPDLSGYYNLKGENYFIQQIDSEQNTKRKSGTWTWVPFWHPRAGNQEANSLPITGHALENSGHFWVVQSQSTQFEVRKLSRNSEQIESIVFDQKNGDYSCSNGVVTLKQRNGGGYSDGVGVEMKVEMRISRGVDESILYHQRIETKSRSLFIFSKQTVTDDYYWFARGVINGININAIRP